DYPDCISCWIVTWEEGEISWFLLAVNRSTEGFITSLSGINSFTNSQAHNIKSLKA
ncbi:hypothetical protein LY78DRAFT_595172, partial [Colletotrichum sublineola]